MVFLKIVVLMKYMPIIAALVVAVVIGAAAVVVVTGNNGSNSNGSAEQQTVSSVAQAFSEGYDGAFGKFTVSDTKEDTVVLDSSITGRMTSSKYTVVVTDKDAKATFDKLKTAAAKGITFPMAEDPASEIKMTGLDNAIAYRIDVRMEMSENVYTCFTYLYFAVLNGDKLIYAMDTGEDGNISYGSGIYTGSSLGRNAYNTEALEAINAAAKAVGYTAKATLQVTSAKTMAETFVGKSTVFGDFTVDETASSTTAIATEANRAPKYNVDFTSAEDVDKTFCELRDLVASKGITFGMGGETTEIELDGYSNVFAYKLQTTMAITETNTVYMTFFYFAAYNGSSMVSCIAASEDGSEIDQSSGIYYSIYNESHPTDEKLVEAVNAGLASIGVTGTVTLAAA